ncbi:SdiA-regulated domain-containing protein [Stutzerimonas stutzeri]|uniref:DNA-binding protein n=1 Tax=Stutzerimonas stutzeri TaxID=316 RepID=A0A172WPX1_STUST|nr:SdiA-regulated domain-containing protein [Stutzerimonas stutzeri]ANF25345.1 DNA-binding protein [Stutzerimonas stutzeri]MCQ4284470.1 SdiA-regulated domain-containing protein [Stutzerimonas stutzeri]
MPDAAVRPSRLRLFLYVSLILTIAMAVLVGWMLHWDDQLKLYWQEQYVDSQERAASIWLPDYELALETTLFGLEDDETSGLTWNAATGTLFTVTGQNPQLVEFSPGGVVLRRITLTGFSDPEAVEALDDGRLAIVDERRRLIAVFRLAPGVESLDLDDLATYDLGFDGAGNKGFEGLAWNPRTKRMLLAKERDPQGLFELPFPGEDGAAGILEAWPEQPLLVRDISSVTIDPRTGHTVMLSDESRLLVELDQRGRPLSFIRLLGGLNGLVEGIDQAEGVAMDGHGDIYVVAEPNLLYVFRRKR